MSNKPVEAVTELPKEVREALESASPEKGVDWSIVLKIWQAAQQYGPAAIVLIKQLISFFQTPDQPTMKGAGEKGHCDHKELCERSLRAALCSAMCAAEHYRACCVEEEECK